ncbi:MAG: hypothetical protein MJ217_02105 [Bacilli bacterium]|nr:hypothetical protein [Bacilli bacterium]
MGIRNFFKVSREIKQSYKSTLNKDGDGAIHVAIHNNIFADIKKNSYLASNSSYASLKNDIKPCIEPYKSNEHIVVDLYETEESDEFARDVAIIGFKRYMNSLCYGAAKTIRRMFAICFTAMLMGILLEILLYGVPVIGNNLPMWLFKTLEVVATLFIWQFFGYLTFEFPGTITNYKRNMQIAKCDFEFRHFD